MSETVRVLPADVYDALELCALIYGGVGMTNMYREDASGENQPCCIHGMARWVDGNAALFGGSDSEPIAAMLFSAGITGTTNDVAIGRINGGYTRRRVPFSDWCAELGVVRGQ